MTNGRGGNIVTMEVMTKERLKRSENDKGINDAVKGRQANANFAFSCLEEVQRDVKREESRILDTEG